eukprot:1149032-Pelagomonas_calceolata.AAC.8
MQSLPLLLSSMLVCCSAQHVEEWAGLHIPAGAAPQLQVREGRCTQQCMQQCMRQCSTDDTFTLACASVHLLSRASCPFVACDAFPACHFLGRTAKSKLGVAHLHLKQYNEYMEA